ncbi:hypothetical protein ETAA8_41900 [Anatilimnocola aggregata]|uniref:Uncharacterized protein n=1 Tax=Anatilimnocola aggregata TaxID=2528021 RepID=A0A517YFS9_9BACT|nr:hypothetical protein ETAA8_41900 [Anatilimnocola aggregata]
MSNLELDATGIRPVVVLFVPSRQALLLFADKG